MAKSKSFFGLRRGSTKSMTFQVLNGAQVTKDRVSEVKNPRTQAQMQQRMIMATTSAAYAAMREIADHSFEGVSYGQESMSKFGSLNNKLLRDNLSAATSQFGYNAYGSRILNYGRYQISKGSLAAPTFTYTASSNDGSISLAITGVTAAGSAPTASELAAALGLSIGEMATVCMIFGNAAATACNFGFVRIKFDVAGDTVLTADNLTDYFSIDTNLAGVTVAVAASSLTFTLTADIADSASVQKCVIYSRKSNNAWLRSTAVFDAPNGLTFTPTAATSLATYPTGTDYVLNGGNV